MLKHRSVLRAAVVLLAVSGLGTSAVVFAESEERAATDSVIEEIVVTATHRETNLMDTAVSISAIDGGYHRPARRHRRAGPVPVDSRPQRGRRGDGQQPPGDPRHLVAERGFLDPSHQLRHRRVYRRHAHDLGQRFGHGFAAAARRRAVRRAARGSTERAAGHPVRGGFAGRHRPLHLQRTGPVRARLQGAGRRLPAERIRRHRLPRRRDGQHPPCRRTSPFAFPRSTTTRPAGSTS